jgi:hypothetical protein
MARSATAAKPQPTPSQAAMRLMAETVTPAQAKQWLDVDNHRNRKLREGRVAYLTDEIRAGRWQVTHIGIAFDPKGNLLDGQHRLAAIVRSGVAVQMVVARNVPPETYIAMDRGLMRTMPDVLRQDQAMTFVGSCLVRQLQLSSYSAPPAPEDIQMVVGGLETEIRIANSIRLSRPLSRVQLRGALALRMAQTPARSDFLMDQWRALNQTDTVHMDTTSAALMRRLLTEPSSMGGRTDIVRARMMTLGWQAFDPDQRQRQQFHIDAASQREMSQGGRRVLRLRCGAGNPQGSRLERALDAIAE